MKNPKRIVFFVDDQSIKSEIDQVFERCPSEWEVQFFSSSQAEGVSRSFEQAAAGVLVAQSTGVCSPGEVLLAEVRSRFHQVSRIALLDDKERGSILRVSGVADDFLLRPCSGQRVLAAVSRAISVRERLSSGRLLDTVNKLQKLPAYPRDLCRRMSELGCERLGYEQIVSAIATENRFAKKIAQIADSVFFASEEKTCTLPDVAFQLGVDSVRSLSVLLHCFSELAGPESGSRNASLLSHAMIVGSFARQLSLAELQGADVAQQSFSAGLLHDFGKLILSANFPGEYEKVISIVSLHGEYEYEAELEVFGVSHAEVGAKLLQSWGFSQPIVEAVLFHHDPEKSFASSFDPLGAVHIANHFFYAQDDPEEAACAEKLSWDFLEKLDIEKQLEDWEVLCQVTIEDGLLDDL